MFELLNVPALDDAGRSGKEIRFSHKADLPKYEESFLAQEWQYLKSQYGYTKLIEKDGVWYAIK